MANERVDVTRIRSGRSAWSPANGWPGVVLLAATYVYFLIFAQFGFLKRLGELGLEDAQLKPVMGAMAVGGILMSLGAPRARFWTCPKCRVQTGLLGCAVMAAMTLLTLTPMLAMAVAAGIGLSLGLLTVTLVACQAYLIMSRGWDERGRRAGLLYAVAGWTGSALGIGMGQNLHAVPMAFVAAAGVLFVAPWIWRLSGEGRKQAGAVALVCVVAWGVQRQLPTASPASAATMAKAGRRVYIAEGCIHCHSQYVRPGTRDVAMWGPVRALAEVKAEEPPLIGNRRQGPDLSMVGSRRSVVWLRLHTMDPRAVSARSIMPGYGYLWAGGSERGEELVAYLASLGSEDAGAHHAAVAAAWKPTDEEFGRSRKLDGEGLFTEHCATCHMAGGQARGMGRGAFKRMPPNLFGDAWFRIAPGLTASQERLAVGRAVKYGLPGTDMPGLEYLPDGEVEAIADWVTRKRSETLDGRAGGNR